jgi:glycosyltransferase involved in cell wall biosynthesis
MLAKAPADDSEPYETHKEGAHGDRERVGYRLRPVLLDEPTAIVHDWFQGMHGSERLVETLRSGLFARARPPDILTFAAAPALVPPELAARIVRQSRLAALPGIRQNGNKSGRWRYLLPYMPHYFASLDLTSYDVVISSSHACAANVRPGADALHVCYCHTPMRYAWVPETDGRRVDGVAGLGLRALRGYLQRVDLEASRRPHAYAANSEAVRRRIHRFYGRDATVIHPPVGVHEFDPTCPRNEDQFLWVHRLVPYKRPDVVVEAFRDLPYRLTMVGVGPLERPIRASLPPNVELLGWLSRDELRRLYERATGFIHVGEEDFGITMVEALAAGTPVIALDGGGAIDIVRDGIDGVLVERPEADILRDAVRHVASTTWHPAALHARALEFSAERFLERMRDWLDECSRDARGSGIRWTTNST